MAFTKVVGAGIHTLSNIHSHNINSSGIITATKFIGPITGAGGDFNAGIVTATSLDVNGNGDISGNLVVGGNLTANGDFTTLNTTLREVELLRVDASTSSIAGIITQSGSGHALYVDGTTILGNSQYVPSFSAATQLAVANLSGNNNSVDVTILGGRTGKSIVKFGDHDSNDRGSISYHHADESINFYNNGNGVTPKVSITGIGSVGIGTDNPTSNLQVDGTSLTLINKVDNNNTIIKVENTGPGNAGVKIKNSNGEFTFLANDRLRIMDEDAGGVERISLASNGNVGINSTSPANKLDVRLGAAWIYPDEDGTEAIALKLGKLSSYNSALNEIWVADYDGSSSPTYRVTNKINRYIANWYFDRTTAPGVTRLNAFQLKAHDSGAAVGNSFTIRDLSNTADSIKLWTNGNSFVGVTTDGTTRNFGIGTNNPTERLTIDGSATDTTPILGLRSGNNHNTTNNGAQIAFGHAGINHYQHFIHTRHNASNSSNAIDFYVCDGTQQNTVTSGSVHTLSMVSGKVSIGTDNPLRTFDVVGNSILVRPTTITTLHSSGNASAVNNSIIVRMPYGENAATTANAGARFGIQFTGANNTTDVSSLNFGNDPVKSASIYGVSEDDLGYNRKVGLAFYTSGFDAAQTEKLRISSNGDVRVGGGSPATFGSGTTVHETYNASTYVANLVTSGTHQLQMIASQTHGATSIGTRSSHNLNLCVNDSTKMIVTTSGTVGINTDNSGSVYGKLMVNSGTASNSATEYYGQDFAINIRSDRGAGTNEEGNGICFSQLWYTDSQDIIRTGAIVGYKSVGSGAFGGGLKFKVQQAGANALDTAMQMGSDRKVVVNYSLKVSDAIQHNGDENTQIRFGPAAVDEITIDTAGTGRMMFKSDGRVVIGNATGTQPSATVGGAQFYGGSYPGDFRISSGAGASGTTTAAIAIMGSNHNANIENGANSGAHLNLYNYNTTDGNSSDIVFLNSNGLSASRILGLNESHSSRTGNLVFMTSDGSHPTEKARLTHDGKFGIGTNDPANDLVVKSPSSRGHASIAVHSSDASTKATMQTVQGSEIRIGGTTAGHPLQLYAGGSAQLTVGATGGFQFHQGNNNSPTYFNGGASNARNYVNVKAGNTNSGHYSGFGIINSSNSATWQFQVEHNGDDLDIFGNSAGGRLRFWTKDDGASSSTIKMQLTQAGELDAKPRKGNTSGSAYNMIPRGRAYEWSVSDLSPSIGSSSSGWYTIMDIADGTFMFWIGTNAHTSALVAICNGYDNSRKSSVNCLQYCYNSNSTYLNVHQIRVTKTGLVQVYLEASSPQYFAMYVQVIGNNDHPNFYSTLTKDTGSPQVDHSIDLKTIASAGYDGLMYARNLRVEYKGLFAGNVLIGNHTSDNGYSGWTLGAGITPSQQNFTSTDIRWFLTMQSYYSTGSAQTKIGFQTDGKIYARTTSIQAFSSERRTKKNIVKLDLEKSWNTLRDTPMYTFNYKDEKEGTAAHHGPIVDECPEDLIVPTQKEDEVGVINTVNTEKLQYRAYCALQQALKRIEQLEAEVAALKGE